MDSEAPVTIDHEFFVVLKGGVKGKVTITAKPDGEIVSSINGILLQAIGTPSRVVSSTGQIEDSRVAGIRRIQNPDGSITPVPSEKAKTDIKLFVDSSPCWFPECEELRAAYKEELGTMLALYTDPADCPACEKGALMRKYLKKMERINTDPR